MKSNCPPSQRPKPVALAAVALALAVILSGCGDAGRAGGSASGVAATPVLVPLTNMVPIRAGSFMRVKYPVTLTRDFWIGRYEVTQGEFMAVTGKNPSHFTGDPNHPVEKVSFVDASNYCAVVTQRAMGPTARQPSMGRSIQPGVPMTSSGGATRVSSRCCTMCALNR